MSRPLDHLVLGTHDLDALGARFSALGFTVGARNRHPWGTENRIVQFSDKTFLELITIGDASLIPPHAPGHFSFGAFVRDALERRPGLSMLVLKGEDARADAAMFKAAGIGDFAPFDFARKGKRSDGTETEVAFSLAFARDETMPEAAFFTCQQHFPQNFWSKPAQTHSNGATGISRVSMVAENPSDHHIFLSAFAGEREMRSTSFGIEIEAGASVVEILTPTGFSWRYGRAAPSSATPIFAGIMITVPDLTGIESAATLAGIGLVPVESGPGLGLLLPAGPDFSTAILFETGGA